MDGRVDNSLVVGKVWTMSIIKKMISFFCAVLLLVLASGCASIKESATGNIQADEVTLYFGPANLARAAADTTVVEVLAQLCSRLQFTPTDADIDMASMISVHFFKEGQPVAFLSTDRNGVFWLEGSARYYTLASGRFDYAKLLDIYQNATIPKDPLLPLPPPLSRPDYPLPEDGQYLSDTPVFIWPAALTDIGAEVCPDWRNGIDGELVDDRHLLIRGQEGTVVYDLSEGHVIAQIPERLFRLAPGFYYSDSSSSLYNNLFQVAATPDPQQVAIPGLDGQSIVAQSGIAFKNLATLETKALDLKETYQYDGRAWITRFDGENIYFTATCSPDPGGDGIGFFNVRNGSSFFSPVPRFSGVPFPAANGTALFWQDGSGAGADGTYCLYLDTAAKTVAKINTGSPMYALSPNGKYIATIDSGSVWDSNPPDTVICVYDAATMAPIRRVNVGLPILSDRGAHIRSLSISNEGNWVCFAGVLWEGAPRAAGAAVGQSGDDANESYASASLYLLNLFEANGNEAAGGESATEFGSSAAEAPARQPPDGQTSAAPSSSL